MNALSKKSAGQKRDQAYDELHRVCQLWIAASEAKDARIRELEEECRQLGQRVARLSKLVGRRSRKGSPAAVQTPARRRRPSIG
jgi:hypothetical protein